MRRKYNECLWYSKSFSKRIKTINKRIKQELDKNQEVKAKIREFEEKRYEVQLEALKGEEQEKAKLEEMQKIYIDLMNDELAKSYFDIELKFNVLLADVNKIIAESVQDVIK